MDLYNNAELSTSVQQKQKISMVKVFLDFNGINNKMVTTTFKQSTWDKVIQYRYSELMKETFILSQLEDFMDNLPVLDSSKEESTLKEIEKIRNNIARDYLEDF